MGPCTSGGGHMNEQGYISDELSHLTGYGKSQDAALEILRKILGSCRLGKSLSTEDSRFAGLPEGIVGIHRDWKPARSHEFFFGDVVCFCDIPRSELGVHSAKYGYHGVAFKKSFLVKLGANPVFYVDQNSIAHFSALPHEFRDAARDGRSFEGLDKWSGRWQGMLEVLPKLKRVFHPILPGAKLEPWAREQFEGLNLLLDVVQMNMMVFMKGFDSSLPQDHLENYYMEREWRLIGPISFELSDLAYVYAPAHHVTNLINEFPILEGKIGPVPSAGRGGGSER